MIVGDNAVGNEFADELNGGQVAPRALLSAIVDSSQDAIVSKTLEGIITSWNAGAEAMFGYRADEVIGRSIRLIIPSDRQAEEDYVLSRIRRAHAVDRGGRAAYGEAPQVP